MITNFKFRDLTPGDVEVRVAMCRANGLSLLIYKDARVDQQILDETVGQLNWKKSYREVKGNLYCTIEIWDSDKSTWIAKEDCGVESNTERMVMSDFNAKFLAYTAKILLIRVLLNRTSIFSVKDEF